MFKQLIFLCGIVGSLGAKVKVTVYNESNESIVVSVDTKPRDPLKRNLIEPNEAKNFFVPPLYKEQPYYLVIQSSSSEKKQFIIRRSTNNKKEIHLMRGDLIIDSIDSLALSNPYPVITVVYNGSIIPAIPEINFLEHLQDID